MNLYPLRSGLHANGGKVSPARAFGGHCLRQRSAPVADCSARAGRANHRIGWCTGAEVTVYGTSVSANRSHGAVPEQYEDNAKADVREDSQRWTSLWCAQEHRGSG